LGGVVAGGRGAAVEDDVRGSGVVQRNAHRQGYEIPQQSRELLLIVRCPIDRGEQGQLVEDNKSQPADSSGAPSLGLIRWR
jgi:hypothetical protein